MISIFQRMVRFSTQIQGRNYQEYNPFNKMFRTTYDGIVVIFCFGGGKMFTRFISIIKRYTHFFLSYTVNPLITRCQNECEKWVFSSLYPIATCLSIPLTILPW